ncbi:helix-turn-helix domain-containing protein [Mobilitalea sibirica]|uniref:Helix-turn-helix domain-containing protein n=1 Tax=Mobilitalea sibirica TaxID=1462919 RepID=A0A8J7KXE1_9FIRM|nr:helix-turn-helix domain-containing protein [Mobilitalea sibirica]MBH1941682.1 helix-turn-helix domain-containing protein [Mobilitalea sibirica]
MSILNERIKERRLALDMTLLQVAEALGVKEATVQRYESGEIKNIKHETIAQLAEIFHCPPGYLMGWEDIPLIHYDDLSNGDVLKEDTAPYISTVAAHKDDSENWTPEELKKIEEYKQLLLAARKNKK